jgi:hypothetical protein
MNVLNVSSFKMSCIKFQYWLTLIIATLLGVSVLFFPDFTLKLFMMKPQDQVVYGISGSVYLAFALLSFLGIKNPFKWFPFTIYV